MSAKYKTYKLDEMSEQAAALVVQIRKLLAGQPPQVQGVVIADLSSMWIAGWNPKIRDDIMERHFDLVRDLMPVNEKIMFGDAGFPVPACCARPSRRILGMSR
jgi:hypothetical protein